MLQRICRGEVNTMSVSKDFFLEIASCEEIHDKLQSSWKRLFALDL